MSTETASSTWQWGRWEPPSSSGQTTHQLTDQVDVRVLIWCSHTFRSRSVVQIQAGLVFEPEKVNIFNKDCRRGGKEVSCMSVTVCLSLHSRTRSNATATEEVGELASGGGAALASGG